MPYPIANLTKQNLRQYVAQRPAVDDWWPESTTSAGNAGGTTAVFSSLVGYPRSSFVNCYLLLTSGTYAGQWRIISDFAPATGTITVARAFGGQVVASPAVTVEIHKIGFRPDRYTLDINQAMSECAPWVWRPIDHHTFVRNSSQRTFPIPRNMLRVMRLSQDERSSDKLTDYFDRTASTTSPGSLWTASSGTWGITNESLYGATVTNGQILLAANNPQVKNGVIQATLRGDTTAADYMVVSLLFRYEDTTHFLYVRLLNGQVDLRKRDGDGVAGQTDVSLTTGIVTTTEAVDYVVRIQYNGSWVDVWVDDVLYIHYQLLGLDLGYIGFDESGTGTYGNVGFRADISGAPSAATTVYVRDYHLHEIVGRVEITDWQQVGRMIEVFPRWGGTLSPSRLLWLEGSTPLSPLATDTTFGTLASDTTATVEIQTADLDPALNIILDYAAALMCSGAASPGNGLSPEVKDDYRKQAAGAFALAEKTKHLHAMPRPPVSARHA